MPRLALVLLCVAGGASPAVGQASPAAATDSIGLRTNHAVGYYDPTLQRVILIGGVNPARATDRDRIWHWSGSRWEAQSDSGPPARSSSAAAYDARGRRGIVTGGTRSLDDSTYETIGDTWEGVGPSWRKAAGADLVPRDHHAMAYDEARSAILMFGGMPARRAEPWPADTWELNATGWARVATEGPAPRARTAVAYDRKRRQVVLFGGVGQAPGPGQAQPFLGDTWVWQDGRWRQVAADGPRGRYAHGMVFDEKAGVVLLYSGAAAHRNAPLADMWQWDGERWTEIPLAGPTPGYRYQPVMVYDRARARTVLYGGLDGPRDDTWEWDGRRWSRVNP